MVRLCLREYLDSGYKILLSIHVGSALRVATFWQFGQARLEKPTKRRICFYRVQVLIDKVIVFTSDQDSHIYEIKPFWNCRQNKGQLEHLPEKTGETIADTKKNKFNFKAIPNFIMQKMFGH